MPHYVNAVSILLAYIGTMILVWVGIPRASRRLYDSSGQIITDSAGKPVTDTGTPDANETERTYYRWAGLATLLISIGILVQIVEDFL